MGDYCVPDMTQSIDLAYQLSTRWNNANCDRCDDASEGQLLYEMFLGDLVLRVGDADFSAPWGWVPILDVARQLMRAVRQLPATRRVEVDFTESEAILALELEDGWVSISSTYSPAHATVRMHDFDIAVHRFVAHAIDEFEMRCPGLKNNPLMRDVIAAM